MGFADFVYLGESVPPPTIFTVVVPFLLLAYIMSLPPAKRLHKGHVAKSLGIDPSYKPALINYRIGEG
ncbi:hypothetical protein CW713_05170 [Methanophagales archaeon]|nr:MAG: hypothetical protein CW713_05170 [Methanophagales archaeon]